jgi:hypothetical protein
VLSSCVWSGASGPNASPVQELHAAQDNTRIWWISATTVYGKLSQHKSEEVVLDSCVWRGGEGEDHLT